MKCLLRLGLILDSRLCDEKKIKSGTTTVSVPKNKNGTSVMCWGAIRGGSKGPFFIWPTVTKEEKKKAKEEIANINKKMQEKKDRLNCEWKQSEEWRRLRDRELRVAAKMHAAAKSAGQRVKTTQLFWGKKFTFRLMRIEEGKGVDSWRYVTHHCRPILWPACKERMVVSLNFKLMEDNTPSVTIPVGSVNTCSR